MVGAGPRIIIGELIEGPANYNTNVRLSLTSTLRLTAARCIYLKRMCEGATVLWHNSDQDIAN